MPPPVSGNSFAMAGTPFACAYDETTRTLTLSGDLDDTGALQLRHRLTALTADHSSSLVMDLSRVETLPSAAVGVIAAARADMRAHFHQLDLVAAPGSLARSILPRCGMKVRDVSEGLAGSA
jgi:anti-anti-sigma factor